MSAEPPSISPQNHRRNPLVSLWNTLTEPAPEIREPERRRRARMLASILLTLVVLGIMAMIATIVGGPSPGGSLRSSLILLSASVLGLTAVFAISRTVYYRYAALLTIFIVLGAVLAATTFAPNSNTLKYLVLGVVLAGLFFSQRGTALVLGIVAVGLLWLEAASPLTGQTLVDTLFFMISVGVLVMVSAFTQQQDIKHIEEQARRLADSEERFRAVIQSADEAIVTADSQANIVAWNAGAQTMFGYSEADALGGPVSLLLPPDQAAAELLIDEMRSLAESIGVSKTLEAQGRRANGTLFPAELSLVSWRTAQGSFYTAFVRDVTQRKQAEEAVQQSKVKLEGLVKDLEKHAREMDLLNDLGDFLQASRSLEEAYSAIGQYAGWLFPGTRGAVFAYSPSRNDLEAMTAWGESQEAGLTRTFSPDECWALRRGRMHLAEHDAPGLRCGHTAGAAPTPTLCVPMTAQGEMLGLLHLRLPPLSERSGSLDETQQLAVMVSEHIALALANLKLRETLRSQSIRDPLTGLFNRRYLEETFDREIRRAERSQRSFSVIMIDVDHFKTFNDTFGHDAGDIVLQTMGQTISHFIRGGDIASRYGGEEFVLLLPEVPSEIARRRADELREAVSQLHVQHRGQLLDGITLSLGVASYPEHGQTRDELVRAADQALYRSKQEGRNRVSVARPVEAEVSLSNE